MQKDMHYYAILYLCIAAGLAPDEAVKVAYSSQYVDDSVHSHKVEVIYSDGSKETFDPIRTAHNGLKSFGTGVQEKVYYPFHFLPGLEGGSYEEMTITHAGYKNKLFKQVTEAALKSGDSYRIGISIHVLADTFSHDGFSGLWSHFNHVEQVKFVPSRVSWWKAIVSKLRWGFQRRGFQLAPAIGHGKAGTLPDIPYLSWSYKKLERNLEFISNNLKFCTCLWVLYKEIISKINNKAKARIDDDDLRKVLWEGVMQNKILRRRCSYWKNQIEKLVDPGTSNKEFMQNYSPKKWLKEVGKWRGNILFLKSRFKLKVSKKDFENSNYFKFHQEAWKHRKYILGKISAEFSKMIMEPGFENLRISIQMIEGNLKQTEEKKLLF